MPAASLGGPETLGIISGRVAGAKPGEQIVLYAHPNNLWWVQPLTFQPFTPIAPDGTWSAEIHLGMDYAALLVDKDFHADPVSPSLPAVRGQVLAMATVHGTPTQMQKVTFPPKTITFGGYDWQVRTVASKNGGKSHFYSPENVWLDRDGALHLRLSRMEDQWVCAEVSTLRTLGYGTYRFTLRNAGNLDPAAALGIFTWSDDEPEQNHREMDIHFSRWGNPQSKNAEYLIQPYYVPANVYRFDMPSGPITTSFRWTPGSAEFNSIRGTLSTAKPFASWDFTAGIPSPSHEKTYINLCEFSYSEVPLVHAAEVVIDRFQFLP